MAEAIPRPQPSSPEGEGRDAPKLRSAQFRRGREESWRALDGLVSRIEKGGLAGLSAEEAQRLPFLYRAALSSLSVARATVLDRNLLVYLENLSLRAYLVVYGPRAGMLHSLAGFFRRDFPRSVRALRRHLAVAFAALLLGTVVGLLLVQSDLSHFSSLVPESLAGGRGPASSAQELIREELFAPWPGYAQTFVVFANSLFRHNTLVGLLSFGLGFALGVPTVLLLVFNGLILGAFIALHADKGLALDFLGWLLIHGVTELLAVLLCGAAGLLVAEKILFPGQLPRLENLARHGRAAAGVVAGTVPLFFIAGFLEGGFRQLIDNTPGRYAFALATGALWLWYFSAAGRDRGHGPGD
ncbi:MAG: stage II sporulation protein M [Deltaproteobacteria bacterium]|jgi:uncharacterized membrane protein SpoIIM required for sporulation|nr:stage II sporulation protein M [Deltaproteobacteria bacterium]